MTVREISNVKTEKEMKDILMQKLKDENCGFNRSEIKIKPTELGYNIWVVGYEHCTFELKFDYDDMFGYIIVVDKIDYKYPDDAINVIYESSKHIYDLKYVMLLIAYEIASTF
jgi:hypothetical protein